MSKKIVIILVVIAAALVVFGIVWDVLRVTEVITSTILDPYTSYIIALGGACGIAGALLASHTAAKKKPGKHNRNKKKKKR